MKSTDIVTHSNSIGITSVQKYINSMRLPWNSSAIKPMHKRLKPGLFPCSLGRPGNEASHKPACITFPTKNLPDFTTISCFGRHSAIVQHNTNLITVHSQVTIGSWSMEYRTCVWDLKVWLLLEPLMIVVYWDKPEHSTVQSRLFTGIRENVWITNDSDNQGYILVTHGTELKVFK